MDKGYSTKLRIYKPNKKGSGGAIQFDLNIPKESVFLEAASQSGERQFDWGNKIVFKLSPQDIGKLLAVVEGRTKNCDIYHEPSKSPLVEETTKKNVTLNLSKGDYGFFLKISAQKTGGEIQSIQLPVSEDEAVLLKILLSKAVEKIFGW